MDYTASSFREYLALMQRMGVKKLSVYPIRIITL